MEQKVFLWEDKEIAAPTPARRSQPLGREGSSCAAAAGVGVRGDDPAPSRTSLKGLEKIFSKLNFKTPFDFSFSPLCSEMVACNFGPLQPSPAPSFLFGFV